MTTTAFTQLQKDRIDPLIAKIPTIKTRILLVLCIVFVCLAFTINLVNGQLGRDYISDDVANQEIVQSLIRNHGGHGGFPQDSFIIHFPLYLLTDVLIHDNSRIKLFLQAYLLAMLLIAGTMILLIYYLKKTNLYNRTSIVVSTLVLSFILSMHLFAQYMLAIDQRQLEIGIMLLLLIPAHIFMSAGPVRTRWRTLLYGFAYVLAMGMLWYDDPYFMYIMAGGTVLTSTILWVSKKISWQKIAVIATTLLSSAVLAKLYEVLFEKLGIYITPPGDTVILGANSIFTNLQNTMTNVFLNFNGALFGLDIQHTNKKLLITFLSGTVLAIFAIASLIHSTKKYFQNAFVLRTLLSTIAISLLLVYYLTQSSTIVERYFITLPFLLLPITTEYILYIFRSKYYRIGQLFIAVMSVGLLLMLATNAHGSAMGITHKEVTAHNDTNYAIIHEIERTGYKKGYANYWQAPLDTYLSSNGVTFLSVTCAPGGYVTPDYWLINEGAFQQPAGRSFFLYDPDISGLATCTIPQLERQFGPPASIVHVSDKTILLYNYDIVSKFHTALPS